MFSVLFGVNPKKEEWDYGMFDRRESPRYYPDAKRPSYRAVGLGFPSSGSSSARVSPCVAAPRPLILLKELIMGSLRSIRFGVLGGVVALVAVFGLSYLRADARAGQGESNKKGEAMEREIIRVEPIATNFEKWGVPVSVYKRYLPKDYPARIFCIVPTWPGTFDIEMDRTAIRGEK
jgi:hypothetical protein